MTTSVEGRRLQLARHLVAIDRFTGLVLALRLVGAGDMLGTVLIDRIDQSWTHRHTSPDAATRRLLLERLPAAFANLDPHRLERVTGMVKPYVSSTA